MLDWRRVYKRDLNGCLNFDEFVMDGLIDFKRLLHSLQSSNILCINCEGLVCTLEFSDADESEFSRIRLVYSVLYTICEIVRFLQEPDTDIELQCKSIRHMYKLLSKTYSANGIVVSADMDKLVLRVLRRDHSLDKVFKGSVYTVDERVELHEILDLIHDIGMRSTITARRVLDCNAECIKVTEYSTLKTLMEQFSGIRGTAYVSVDENYVFQFDGVDGSMELDRFDTLCELLHTIGYYLPVLDKSVYELFESLWGSDSLVSEHYMVQYFKGNYGIVRKG